MAWKKLTEEELNTLEFDFDEDLIDRGLEAARPALEAAGCEGPEKQRTALASGKVGLEIQNNKLVFSSVSHEHEALSQWLFSSKASFEGMSTDQISTEIMNRVEAEKAYHKENLRKLRFASSVDECNRLTEGENMRHQSVLSSIKELISTINRTY